MLVVVSVVVDGLVDVVVSSVVVVLVCANAKGATSPQTKAMIVLFTLMPPFLIRFTPTVRDSELRRTLLVVNLFVQLLLRKFKVFAISAI